MTKSPCSKPTAANLGGKKSGTSAATKSAAGGGKGERNMVGSAASGAIRNFAGFGGVPKGKKK